MRRRTVRRPTGSSQRGAQIVAVVAMGVFLFIVITFRDNVATSLSALLGTIEDNQTTDLETAPAPEAPPTRLTVPDLPTPLEPSPTASPQTQPKEIQDKVVIDGGQPRTDKDSVPP